MLSPHTLEPMLWRRKATAMRSLPLAVTREKPMQQLRPSTAKKKKKTKTKTKNNIYIYKNMHKHSWGVNNCFGRHRRHGTRIPETTVVEKLLEHLKQQLLGTNVQDSPFWKPFWINPLEGARWMSALSGTHTVYTWSYLCWHHSTSLTSLYPLGRYMLMSYLYTHNTC